MAIALQPGVLAAVGQAVRVMALTISQPIHSRDRVRIITVSPQERHG